MLPYVRSVSPVTPSKHDTNISVCRQPFPSRSFPIKAAELSQAASAFGVYCSLTSHDAKDGEALFSSALQISDGNTLGSCWGCIPMARHSTAVKSHPMEASTLRSRPSPTLHAVSRSVNPIKAVSIIHHKNSNHHAKGLGSRGHAGSHHEIYMECHENPALLLQDRSGCDTMPHRISRPSGMSLRKKFSDREFFSRSRQGGVAGKVPANAADKTGKGANA